MSNSHQFGSWNRPRPRGELRFFADLEEQNNRSDYSFQRRHGKHFKPYDQRHDRYSYSKHHQRDYASSSRNRYSSESSHKYVSSGRTDHAIDPIRRQQSDEPIPSRSTTSASKWVSRSGRSVSIADDGQKRDCSPFPGCDDENAGHESYQHSGANDNDCDSGQVRRMREKSSQMIVRAKSRETSEDFPSGRTSSSGSGCRRRRRESDEASGGSHRPGSESSTSCSTYCRSPYGETRHHNEGNIDLVHMTKREEEDGI